MLGSAAVSGDGDGSGDNWNSLRRANHCSERQSDQFTTINIVPIFIIFLQASFASCHPTTSVL